ncbi:MAG: GTP-binding protein [Galactobacter sp.]
MDIIKTTAVVGTCARERSAFARDLAALTGDALWSAGRLGLVPDPIDEAASLIPWLRIPGADPDTSAILEFPASVPVEEIIARLAETPEGGRLTRLICVVDVAHLLADLASESYLPVPADGPGVDYTGIAAITATQLEYSTHVALVNTEYLEAAELGRITGLITALAPEATLLLETPEDSGPASTIPTHSERPGWVHVLNDDSIPVAHPSVSVLRWEQIRPLHPRRFVELFEDHIEHGHFGRLVRSAGFLRLSTRPGVTAGWQHVGSLMSLEPMQDSATLQPDDELLALGQDLALIGLDLDEPALRAALDDATLTDAELEAGPQAWATYPDPFPAWAPMNG